MEYMIYYLGECIFDCSVVNSGYEKADTCTWALWHII